MYRLFSLSALLLFVSADPRSPKIYNVLISTKKNLSPSHALPVYEPVLRTTSLGIALPPIFYHSPIATFGPNFVAKPQVLDGGQNTDEKTQNVEDLQRSLHPLPVDQFIPYTYTPHILNPGGYYAPIQSSQEEQKPKVLPNTEPFFPNSNDPKNVIANLKRNPNIPDVPPPALPTRNMA